MQRFVAVRTWAGERFEHELMNHPRIVFANCDGHVATLHFARFKNAASHKPCSFDAVNNKAYTASKGPNAPLIADLIFVFGSNHTAPLLHDQFHIAR